MNIEEFRDYCIGKKGVTEEFPFDDVTLVFKVMGKMFALTGVESFERINLKCEPNRAQELRATYPSIQGAYHMNKKHWNSVMMDGSIPMPLIMEMIDESYNLVVSKLSKKQKDELKRGTWS